MATPPNKQYKWATDSTFDTSVGPSGSAWHNEPNKVLPVALRVSQGYVPSQPLDAESLNYNFNSLGDWVEYLSSSLWEGPVTPMTTSIPAWELNPYGGVLNNNQGWAFAGDDLV